MPVTLHPAGRVLVVRTVRVIDGAGPNAEQLALYAKAYHATLVLIDTTRSEYVDSDGIRWLLRLTDLTLPHKIVTIPNSRTDRTLNLFGCALKLFHCSRTAWRAPWHDPP